MVAGGMESMTNAPYLMLKGRGGYRMGHDKIYDHMMLDGLEDAYEAGRSMGTFGEDCAAKYSFTREQQDAFAIASVTRAKAATESGAFAAEIAPVTVKDRSGERVVCIDEGPGKVKLDKITSLKPAFKKDGTITAASSSSINDGAAALVLMRESTAKAQGLKPLARIVAHSHARAGTQLVRHRAGGRHAEAAGQDRLERGGRGPVGDQRSLRRGAHGADDRAEHSAREGQRQRRRLRAGPPDRRQRRAHPGHADPCAAGAWRQEGRGHAVHRRRRSHRHGASSWCNPDDDLAMLNQDQLMIRDAVRSFAQEQLWPHAAKWDKEHHFPTDVHKGLAELGAYGICVPEALGGAGLDYVTLAVVLEEIAAGDGGTSTAISVTNCPVNAILMRYGNAAAAGAVAAPAGRRPDAGRVLPDRAARGLGRVGACAPRRSRRATTTCSTASSSSSPAARTGTWRS